MFKDRLLDALKSKKNMLESDEKMSRAMSKIQKQKRLSSEEFLEVYDSLRCEGPQMKYLNPDGQFRELKSSFQSSLE